MSCILRVVAKKGAVGAIVLAGGLKPYRSENRGGEEDSHFEIVGEGDLPNAEFVNLLQQRLGKYRNDILLLRAVDGVRYFGLDIALTFESSMASTSIEFPSKILFLFGELGLSCTLSCYN